MGFIRKANCSIESLSENKDGKIKSKYLLITENAREKRSTRKIYEKRKLDEKKRKYKKKNNETIMNVRIMEGFIKKSQVICNL